jgi:citrate lyase subunit beta/citryl-CoA lyase
MTALTAYERVATAKSLLFVPGDRPDRFTKARSSGADLVVVDLEDAVAQSDKPIARRAAVAWLHNGGEAVVRINSDLPTSSANLEALAHALGCSG